MGLEMVSPSRRLLRVLRATAINVVTCCTFLRLTLSFFWHAQKGFEQLARVIILMVEILAMMLRKACGSKMRVVMMHDDVGNGSSAYRAR